MTVSSPIATTTAMHSPLVQRYPKNAIFGESVKTSAEECGSAFSLWDLPLIAEVSKIQPLCDVCVRERE